MELCKNTKVSFSGVCTALKGLNFNKGWVIAVIIVILFLCDPRQFLELFSDRLTIYSLSSILTTPLQDLERLRLAVGQSMRRRLPPRNATLAFNL